MLNNTDSVPPSNGWRQLGSLLRLVRPYWLPLVGGFTMALALSAASLVPPFLTKLLIDEVYPTGQVALLHVLVLGVLAFGVASALLGSLRAWCTLYFETRLAAATRLLFLNHLQNQDIGFFDRRQVGEVNSRFQDVAQTLRLLGEAFETLFVQGAYLSIGKRTSRR